MKSYEAIPVLNRLLNRLCRSLPAYLADAPGKGSIEAQRIQSAIERLASDERMYANRVAQAIDGHGGRPNPGLFPPEFSAKHDLDLAYLLENVVDSLDQDIAWYEQCATELEGDSSLHALAEEILGNAKGHLDVLIELLNRPRGSL